METCSAKSYSNRSKKFQLNMLQQFITYLVITGDPQSYGTLIRYCNPSNTGIFKNAKYYDYRDILLINPCNTMILIIKELDIWR